MSNAFLVCFKQTTLFNQFSHFEHCCVCSPEQVTPPWQFMAAWMVGWLPMWHGNGHVSGWCSGGTCSCFRNSSPTRSFRSAGWRHHDCLHPRWIIGCYMEVRWGEWWLVNWLVWWWIYGWWCSIDGESMLNESQLMVDDGKLMVKKPACLMMLIDGSQLGSWFDLRWFMTANAGLRLGPPCWTAASRAGPSTCPSRRRTNMALRLSRKSLSATCCPTLRNWFWSQVAMGQY